MQKQSKNFNKDRKSFLKNQTKILEVKDTIIELKKSIEGFNNRVDKAEKKSSKHKNNWLKIFQRSKNLKRLKNNLKSWSDLWSHIKMNNNRLLSPRKRRKWERTTKFT